MTGEECYLLLEDCAAKGLSWEETFKVWKQAELLQNHIHRR